MQDSAYPLSIVYNGDRMDKVSLMLYLNELIRMRNQLEKMFAENRARREQVSALSQASQRRTFPQPPEMREPSGLAVLSPAKWREYENWVARAPERAWKRRQQEEAEDRRIEGLQQEIAALQRQSDVTRKAIQTLSDIYMQHCQKQILPPEYREPGIPEQLLKLLFNGRAHTLTDAINLYHEEQHRARMVRLAEQQNRKLDQLMEQQEALAWQQMQLQLEQLEEQRALREQVSALSGTVDQTAHTLETIRFFETMRYLTEIF